MYKLKNPFFYFEILHCWFFFLVEVPLFLLYFLLNLFLDMVERVKCVLRVFLLHVTGSIESIKSRCLYSDPVQINLVPSTYLTITMVSPFDKVKVSCN